MTSLADELGFSRPTMVLTVILIILWIVLIHLLIKLFRQRYGLYPGRVRDVKVSAKRLERRYQTIEHWIITKRVIAHDDFCGKCQHAQQKLLLEEQKKEKETPTITANGTIVKKSSTMTSSSSSSFTVATEPAKELSDYCLECNTSNSSDEEAQDDSQQQGPLSSHDSMATASALAEYEEPVVVTMEKDEHNQTATANNLDDDDDLEAGLGGSCAGDGSMEPSPNECAICFGTFRVGSIVSWAVNEKCSHVYHHECIKEWLVRRSGCPTCRRTMLLVDRYDASEDRQGYYAYTHWTSALRLGNRIAKPNLMQKWSDQYVQRAATTYCCVKDGLIAVPKTMLCTRDEIAQLSNRIIGCVVQPKELEAMRGNRQDATTTVAAEDPIHMQHAIPPPTSQHGLIAALQQQAQRVQKAKSHDDDNEDDEQHDNVDGEKNNSCGNGNGDNDDDDEASSSSSSLSPPPHLPSQQQQPMSRTAAMVAAMVRNGSSSLCGIPTMMSDNNATTNTTNVDDDDKEDEQPTTTTATEQGEMLTNTTSRCQKVMEV